MREIKRQHQSFALLLTLTLTIAGCFGLDKESEAPMAIRGNLASIEAFEQTLFPLVRQQCIQCHGNNQRPLFAVKDPGAAHEAALTVVNLNSIESSRIIRKSNDGHCGSRCSGDNSDLVAAIVAWRDAINSSGGDDNNGPAGRYVTEALEIPANLPGPDATPITLRFALSTANPDLVNATFELSIRGFGLNNDAYQVDTPSIETADKNIYFSDIMVHINGVDDPTNATYRPLRDVVPPPGLQLSDDSMIVLQSDGPGRDRISISFAVLEEAPNCRDLARFEANVLPKMQSTCFNCHRGGNSAATALFDMRAPSNAALCAKSLVRVNKDDPMESLIIKRPWGGYLGHPQVLSDAERDQFLDWINSER